MALLPEYAITPQVFDVDQYSGDEHRRTMMSVRREIVERGVVRDLRDGEWSKIVGGGEHPWHGSVWRKVLMDLWNSGRLIPVAGFRRSPPSDEREWCEEALAGHDEFPMRGSVVVTKELKTTSFSHVPLVQGIDRLSSSDWRMNHGCSVRLKRTLDHYRKHLEPILHYATSLWFIDPHIDPREERYHGFIDLVKCAGGRRPPPEIQIHRVCYRGRASDREFPDWQEVFRDKLSAPLQDAELNADVFIWDDFHDRYLISKLIGVMIPNGFDTSKKANDMTTWSRLSGRDRADVEKEFAENSPHHELRYRFTIP